MDECKYKDRMAFKENNCLFKPTSPLTLPTNSLLTFSSILQSILALSPIYRPD